MPVKLPSESSNNPPRLTCPKCLKDVWDENVDEEVIAVCFGCGFTCPIGYWRRLQDVLLVDHGFKDSF